MHSIIWGVVSRKQLALLPWLQCRNCVNSVRQSRWTSVQLYQSIESLYYLIMLNVIGGLFMLTLFHLQRVCSNMSNKVFLNLRRHGPIILLKNGMLITVFYKQQRKHTWTLEHYLKMPGYSYVIVQLDTWSIVTLQFKPSLTAIPHEVFSKYFLAEVLDFSF